MKILSWTNCLFIFLAAACLSSCAYSRIIECEGVGGRTDGNKNIVFENDTVRVEYNLWGENGNMYYAVYNKLTVPLYVDWYKSAYIESERKFDYKGNMNERKTFIPPHTKVTTPVKYYLLGDANATSGNNSGSKQKITNISLRDDKSSKVEQWPVNGSTKTVTVYSKTFTQATTPLEFRSFITVSTCESADECTNSKNLIFINNDFYVKKISEMKQKAFLGNSVKVSTERTKGNKTVRGKAVRIYEYPYRTGNSFYISLVF